MKNSNKIDLTKISYFKYGKLILVPLKKVTIVHIKVMFIHVQYSSFKKSLLALVIIFWYKDLDFWIIFKIYCKLFSVYFVICKMEKISTRYYNLVKLSSKKSWKSFNRITEPTSSWFLFAAIQLSLKVLTKLKKDSFYKSMLDYKWKIWQWCL